MKRFGLLLAILMAGPAFAQAVVYAPSGNSAAVGGNGSTAPTSSNTTGYIGTDGNLHGWLGDNAGHPAISIFGTPTIANSGFSALGSAGTPLQQGSGAAGANASNVFIGGQNAPLSMAQTSATSTPSSGTVATANAYQSILTANAARKGCLIQNTSTNTELVFLGAPGSATAATSISLPAGATFSCSSSGGLVVADQISLTSTVAASAYVLVSQ